MRKTIITSAAILAFIAPPLAISYAYENKINDINNKAEKIIKEIKQENSSLKNDIFDKNNQLMKQKGEIKDLNKTLKDKDFNMGKLNDKIDILIEENKKLKNRVSTSASSKTLNMDATHYTAFCPTGCIGVTRTGYDVSNTIYYNGMRIIATDPNVIPLNSIVQVEYGGDSFKAIALDTGGDIKNNRIDILVGDRNTAYNLGRGNAKVTILKEGKNL